MKHIYLLKPFLFIFFVFIYITGHSEGTKQIMPTTGGAEKISISASTTTSFGFAWYNCPADNRLNIHIKQAGEIIYFGFQKLPALQHNLTG